MAIGLPARHDRGSLNCSSDIVEVDSITSVAFESAVLVGMVRELELSPLVAIENRSHYLQCVISVYLRFLLLRCFGHAQPVFFNSCHHKPSLKTCLGANDTTRLS